MKISKDLITLVVYLSMIVMFFVVILLALFTESSGRIEIRKSYSTGECVFMIVYDNEYPNGKVQPCPDVLPKRYYHVWVQ